MTTLPSIILERDKTASLPTHLQTLEEHTLPPRPVRILRPQFGSFFTKDFKLFSVDENNANHELTQSQFIFGDYLDEISSAIGKEVYANVLIKDALLGAKFKVTYRALGGEENPHRKNLITSVEHVIEAGSIVDFETDVLGKPDAYNPKHHYTPADTVYGKEAIVSVIQGIKVALQTTTNTQRTKPMQAAARMQEKMRDDFTSFIALIKSHIRAVGNVHNDTAGTIGLGSVTNMGFKEIITGGQVVQQSYASPSKAKAAAASIIGNKVRIHASRKDNPHKDSKYTLGLGKLQNYPIHTGYSTAGGIGSFELTYKTVSLSNPIYVGVYSVKAFVGEYPVNYVNNGGFAEFYSSQIEQRQIELLQTTDKIHQYQLARLILEPKLIFIATNAANAALKHTQTKKEEIEYRLVSFNSCAAQLLQQITLHRPTTFFNTLETTYPTPTRIRGLDLWLDFSDISTLVTVGDAESKTIKSVFDKGGKARLFTQDTPAAQPLLKASKDALVPSIAGITKGTVAVFTSGAQYLKQTKGPALKLSPKGTLVALVRTGPQGSTLNALMKASTSASLVATDGVLIHGDNENIRLYTQSASFAITLPNQSTAAEKYAIVVLSLHATDTNQCWAACTKGSYSPSTTKGLQSATLDAQGLVVDQIGINKASANMQGEIAEILYFTEQLSVSEIKALHLYLTKKWSAQVDMPLALDYVKTAFQAPNA